MSDTTGYCSSQSAIHEIFPRSKFDGSRRGVLLGRWIFFTIFRIRRALGSSERAPKRISLWSLEQFIPHFLFLLGDTRANVLYQKIKIKWDENFFKKNLNNVPRFLWNLRLTSYLDFSQNSDYEIDKLYFLLFFFPIYVFPRSHLFSVSTK